MFELQTMGRVELRGPQGRRVRAVQRRPKDLALLTYLAAARPSGFQRRDSLLALLWPELDQRHARNALSQALHRLRRSLAASALLADGQAELAVAPERLRCDVVLFEQHLENGDLAAAVRLHAGDFLAGFHAPGASAEFDDWVRAERERLRRSTFNALLFLIEAAQAKQDHDGAVEWLRRAAEIRPLDETVHRRLIEGLSAAGDRDGAVAAYEEFARRLAEDCGARPSASTRRAADAVRAAGPRAAPGVPPTTAVAEAFLRGRYFTATLGQTARGLEYLDTALRLDPAYAPARAARALAVANLALLGHLPPQHARLAASAAAARALELDQASSEAHTAAALGHTMFDWNWDASEREFRIALELNPNNVDAHAYCAVLLSAMSRHEEAVTRADHAQQLDPLGPWANFILGWTLYRARRYRESVERLQALVELSPHFALGHLFLAENHLQDGARADAVAACRTAIAARPEDQFLLGIGACVLGLAGEPEQARGLVGALGCLAERSYVSPGYLAAAYAGLGDRDAAFAQWDAMCRDRSSIAFLVPGDPLYDCVRADRRFGGLARRLNLACI
jgi:serine/threonine-protein kinase